MPKDNKFIYVHIWAGARTVSWGLFQEHCPWGLFEYVIWKNETLYWLILYTMSMSYWRRVTFQRLDTPVSPRLCRFFEYQKTVCPIANLSVLCGWIDFSLTNELSLNLRPGISQHWPGRGATRSLLVTSAASWTGTESIQSKLIWIVIVSSCQCNHFWLPFSFFYIGIWKFDKRQQLFFWKHNERCAQLIAKNTTTSCKYLTSLIPKIISAVALVQLCTILPTCIP